MRRVSLTTLALAAALAALLAAPGRPALAATYTVDTTLDTNLTGCQPGTASDCSLRGAINNANISGAGDLITFDINIFPNGGTSAIALGGVLPTLTGGGDTIDAGNATVIVRGVEARSFDCFVVGSSNNTIKGLQITDCRYAVWVTSGSGNAIGGAGGGNTFYDNASGIGLELGTSGASIKGNRIGTDTNGATQHPDGGNNIGVWVEGNTNTIGGVTAGERNVISANLDGLVLYRGASGNVVKGNRIGTDLAGTTDVGNNVGINLSRYGFPNGPVNNVIGGLAPGHGNLISGNTTTNVFVADPDTTGNQLLGNIIGPDVNGSGTAMSNGDGVQIATAANGNTIGPGNVISDNADGIEISLAGTNANIIRGNRIGTNLSGTSAVPNGVGVSIKTGARLNIIGGTGAGEGNTIAFNTADGVNIAGSATPPNTTENPVRGNSIHSNGGLEINNTNNGNLELTPPAVTSTAYAGVSGFACANCVVDVFSDGSLDSRFYEGSTTAAADGSFKFQNDAPFIEINITATNTDAAGNTSELSGAVIIDSDNDGTVDGTDSDDDSDGMLDADDACRVFPEDYDGFDDADGCPDPDNDSDGVCDAGLTSPSCTGTDSGKTAFFAAGHNHTNPTVDCRNTPEDIDAFKDGDGCPEPDNDNDGFPDSADQCPGDDNVTGPDGVLGSGEDQNHDGILNTGEDTVVVDGVLTTDDVVLTFEDYDLVLNTDGCHDSPGEDRDGDGYTDEVEALHIGTLADKPCGGDGWPSNLVHSSVSFNKFDLVDLGSFVAPVRRLSTSPGDTNFSKRWDLKPGPVTPTGAHINIADLGVTIAGASGFPPMLGGTKALNQVCPLPP